MSAFLRLVLQAALERAEENMPAVAVVELTAGHTEKQAVPAEHTAAAVAERTMTGEAEYRLVAEQLEQAVRLA